MNQYILNPTKSHAVTGQSVEIHQAQTFCKFQSETITLNVKDIDTDMIMPAEFLKKTNKEGLGKHIFDNLKKSDTNFPEFLGQRILVAGKNFGCGSSREHAPWGLKDAGIDVIISSDFADIFKGNAEKNGILPIILDESIVQKLLEEGGKLEVDLASQQVIDENGKIYPFEISSFSKKRLLENLSDLDYLLEISDKIKKFDKKQKEIFL